MRHAILTLLCLISSATAMAGEADGPRKAARAVRLSAPIVLDGRLDDAAWKAAPVFTGFERLLTDSEARQPIPPELQTSFQIAYDDTTLYVGVRCNESEMAKLHPYEVTSQWDAAMFINDDVELFFDPVGDRREDYQFAVDPNGAQFDAYFIEGGHTGKPYSSIWQVKTFKGADFWSAEIAIPFAALHLRPSAMWSDTWVFSIARSRLGGGRQGFVYSTFSPTNRGYHDLANYGTLAGIATDRTLHNLTTDRPQVRIEPADGEFRIHAALTIRNAAATPFQGTLDLAVLGENARGGTQPLAIPGHGETTLTFDDAHVKNEGTTPLLIRVADQAGRPVLAARFDERLRYVPLTVHLSEPNYRDGIYATQKVERIAGTIRINMPLPQLAGCVARVTLGSGLAAPQRVERPIDGAEIAFTLPAAGLPEGEHALAVELLRPIPGATPPRPTHTVVAETSLSLRKLPAAPDVEARIDDQGTLFINGNPTMLRGWYGNMDFGMSVASLPRANLPHASNFTIGDSAPELWCLQDVSRLIDEDAAKLDPPLDEGLKARLRAAIASVRGKRNVIGYYLADEPSYRAIPASYLKRVYDFLRATDPYRLVLIVDTAPEDYVTACDAICPHPYPSPLEYADGSRAFGGGLDGIRSCLTRARQANDGGRAVWLMPQVFSYGGVNGRNPNLTEMRWIMLSGIANGAKSLVPFIFFGYWNHLENRIACDAVFEELVFLEPFFTARDAATPATADLPTVDVIAKTTAVAPGGPVHTAIVAVNRSYTACTARISVPSLAKRAGPLLVLREDRVVPVIDGVITDTFPGLGVHVYTTIEALPHLQTLAELAERVAAPQRAAAAAGNLLASPTVHWSLTSGHYFTEDAIPVADREFTSGLNDGYAWLPLGKPSGDCVLLFAEPVTFTRVSMTSASIRDADIDVWTGSEWKTLHHWTGQLLPHLEWSGAATTTTRLRIAVKATRQGTGTWVTPEIAELGLFK